MFGSFRKQKAVYWNGVASVDGYGTPIYQTPVEIDVRWEITNELYVDRYGNEKISKSIVYPNTEVQEKGYLYLGKLDALSVEQKADPTLLVDAYIIQKIQNTPDLNNLTYLFKVWL